MLNSDKIDHHYTYINGLSYLTKIEAKEFIFLRFLKDLNWRLLVLVCWRRLFSSSKASAIKVIKAEKGVCDRHYMFLSIFIHIDLYQKKD